MEKLQKVLTRIKNDFPGEFQSICPCIKSGEHDWHINSPNNQIIVRAIDVVCLSCNTNLAVELKFFAGVQDHG